MELNYFRDRLFDLLNDSEEMGIADLNADEQNSLFTVRTEDGNIFEIVCRQAAKREWKASSAFHVKLYENQPGDGKGCWPPGGCVTGSGTGFLGHWRNV